MVRWLVAPEGAGLTSYPRRALSGCELVVWTIDAAVLAAVIDPTSCCAPARVHWQGEDTSEPETA